MRFRALAADYDGTLATNGGVEQRTLVALDKLRASGRALFLVTGRQLPDLQQAFPQLGLFDRVVAENGALLYRPASGEQQLVCPPASPEFAARLRQRGVPVWVGKAVVATETRFEAEVKAAIHEDGLDLRIIRNKDSLMVLPAGVDKQTGLARALAEMSLSAADVIAVGDAENDEPFLAGCGYGVAVANALPQLKSRADLVTHGACGAGVTELIDRLLADDLSVAGDGARN